MNWTLPLLQEIIAYCKQNNVEEFKCTEHGFEFKFNCKPVYVTLEPEKETETKLTLEDIEKKKQEDYHKLMFMSST